MARGKDCHRRTCRHSSRRSSLLETRPGSDLASWCDWRRSSSRETVPTSPPRSCDNHFSAGFFSPCGFPSRRPPPFQTASWLLELRKQDPRRGGYLNLRFCCCLRIQAGMRWRCAREFWSGWFPVSWLPQVLGTALHPRWYLGIRPVSPCMGVFVLSCHAPLTGGLTHRGWRPKPTTGPTGL
jgi:hypothetical protein